MSSITSSKRAARLSRPPLLLSSHSIQNTQAAFPRSELADRYPSSIHWEPPLSSVGQGRVTSIFPLRKRSGFELQSLESPDTTLVHNPKHSSYQTTLKESRKAPKLDFSEYAMISSSRSYLTLKDELVQPLDGNDAAIKESYDATTIASDILIAANQHPTKWGLNYHLMVLCKNFAVVNFSSDLATFRWDIIDPKPPKPSTSTIATSTFLHGSETSMGELSSSRLQYSSASRSLEPTSHQSSRSFTPCPVEKPVSWTPTGPNRVTKLSSGRIAPRNPKDNPKKTSTQESLPQFSPYFKPSPRPQVVIPASTDHMSPKENPRLPAMVERTAKPQVIEKPDRKSPRKNTYRAAVAEVTRKPLANNEPAVSFCHPFQCQWFKCQKILLSRQSLQGHVMNEHILTSLACQWSLCDCKLPLAAIPLWHHVLDHHLKTVPEKKKNEIDASIQSSIADVGFEDS